MESAPSDAIAIFVRCRNQEGKKALSADPETGAITLHTHASSEDKRFTFDFVGSEATAQEEVFDCVGRPLSDACLAGYNATVFAYGQTGAGKTFTMYGGSGEQRGLTPRVLDHLFALMAREERTTDGEITYRCVGSLLEIYQETITDLLEHFQLSTSGSGGAAAAAATYGVEGSYGHHLRLREDAARGVYVQGLREVELRTPEEAMRMLTFGTAGRTVGATAMNSQSSRSRTRTHRLTNPFIHTLALAVKCLAMRCWLPPPLRRFKPATTTEHAPLESPPPPPLTAASARISTALPTSPPLVTRGRSRLHHRYRGGRA